MLADEETNPTLKATLKKDRKRTQEGGRKEQKF